MKKYFVYVSVLGLLFLAACDLRMNSTINISDILSDSKKVTAAELLINIPSCDDDSIQKVTEKVKDKNFKAKYKTCQNVDMNSYATFAMPLLIVKNEQDVPENEALYLISKDDKLYINTSNRIKSLLSSGDATFDEKLTIKDVSFNIVNDTDSDVTISVKYSFVNGKSVLEQNFDIESYDTISIRLSDVASNILETPNISFPIFEFVKK